MNDKSGEESPSTDKGSNEDKAGLENSVLEKLEENSSPGNTKLLNIISLAGLLLLAAIVCFFVIKGNQQLAEIRETESTQEAAFSDVNEQLTLLTEKDKSQTKTFEQLRANQQSLEESLSSLYEDKPDSNLDWALMEVEYLIVIATQRLLLERDVKTAITALESADQRLKDISNPALIPVREQIASDLNALRGVNAVDRTGLALFLSDLITRAESLPLKKQMIVSDKYQESKAEPEKQNNWQVLPTLVWEELKSLVVIKHKDDDGTAFILPEEEYYLYQNLRLQLENARLSVLNLDSENLKASVEIISSWLKRHFDLNEAAVTNVLETLAQMENIDLQPELPDISSSLETLRVFMKHDDMRATVPGS